MAYFIHRYSKFSGRYVKIILISLLVLSAVKAGAQNINKPNKQGPMGTEVNTYSGNLFISRNDIYIPARGFDINITFHYNSFNFDVDAGYGKGWSFNYAIRYKNDTASGKKIIWGDGRVDRYTSLGGGGFKSPKGYFTTFTQYQPDKYLLTQSDGAKLYFDNNVHQRITKLEEPNGNQVVFNYTDTLLTSLVNAAGQTISFTYNANGRLASVIDAVAAPTRTFLYTYDFSGYLTQVADPLGYTNKYAYLVNGPMKSMTDKNNNVIDIIYFNDFTISEIIGCNKRVSFSYDTATHTSLATDHLSTGSNQVTKYSFKKFEDQVWLTAISGNCCGFNMSFEFDNNGNKIKETDANGQVYTFTYDSRGNMLTQTDPAGQVITYTYSPDFNRVTSYTDAKGNVYSMIYDTRGNLTQLTEPGNSIYTAAYAANGDITGSTDANGNVYSYTYDAYGNPATVTGPHGYHAVLTSDARGNLVSYTDARNNTHTAQFDILNRLKKITDPFSHNLQLNYDGEGNIISFANKNNETSVLNYDASNRMVKFRNAKGYLTELTYDGMNNLVAGKNALGNSVSLTYDNRNRLTSIKDPLGHNTTVGYDANGNITAINMPNGEQFTYTYDAVNRITGIQDANGSIGSYVYDKNNNITSFTNSAGSVIAVLYDNHNRISKMTDALGNAVQLSYDQNNHVLSATDRNGASVHYTYDSLNRVKTFTDKNGFLVTFGYDAQGNVTQLQDQNNHITTYAYDSLNRVKTVTYPGGSFKQYTYDNKRNVTSVRLTDGTVKYFQYDSLGRLISRTLPDGQVFTFGYDALGRITSAGNNSGTVQITYDAINRITSETFDGRTTRYSYNIAGRSQTTLYPDSTVITRNYDTRNRLTGISVNNSSIVSYQYNNTNQVVSKSFGNGVNTDLQYDFASRLSSISTNGGNIQQSAFTYNNERNKTTISRFNNQALSEQFGYDNGQRLTNYKRGIIGGTPVIENSYSYDALGNRISASLNGVNTTYTTNSLNQLTNSNNGATNINFTYDNNGNVTYDGRFFKTYDADGRLLKDSSSPVNVLTYQYDALGRRVLKNLNGTLLKYTFSGLQQIEERNGTNNTLNDRMVYDRFLTPVLIQKNNNSYYYHLNEMNSVEAMTNSTGNLVESYRYDIYGKPAIYNGSGVLIGSSQTGNRFAFTGQEYDSANGNYKFYLRDYNPETGLFNQRDLIGYKDGFGMYQYVHDNPANGIDMFGLKDCPPEATGPFPTDGGGWSVYTINTSSSVSAITSVTSSSKFFMNAPGLNILYTPVAAVSTYNTGSELSQNWDSKTYGQKMDGIMSVGSGTLSTVTGGLTSSVVVGGTAAEMVFGGASFSGALTSALGTAGELFAGTAAAGAVVAAGGGLAIYGIVNEVSKGVSGQSLSELGDQGEGFFADGVKWIYNDASEYETMGNQMRERSSNNMTWVTTQKYLNAKNKVEKKGSHGGSSPWIKIDLNCPQNGTPGGSQDPNTHGPASGNTKPVLAVGPKDPNEIIGPDGQPDKRWVSIKDRLPYTILYENDKTASAPAKFVRVTSPVEPKQDAATFQLGNFGFNNQIFAVPSNTASYYQRLDCRDSLGLYVDITAGYDQINNQAFWEFQSIDPVTLVPPADPLKGFLLLQDSSGMNNGHGYVSFSIKPVQSAVTLDTIGARAEIVFDSNETIPTNIATNTIDAFAPTSHMNALPGNSFNPVSLSWGGTDDAGGCGLKFYTLYVSADGVNYNIIRTGMTRTDTTFIGTINTTYHFFVLATDSVGNTEVLRLGEIKSTYIGNSTLPVTWLYFKGVTIAKDNILDWATANEQNNRQFEVERSLNGSTFSRIGIVHSLGNNNQTNTYQYKDLNIDRLNSPVMYYRLKQLDVSGSSRYSNIVRLNYNQKEVQPSIIYPNPTQGFITITIGDKALLGTLASLYDESGKQLEIIRISANSQTINMGKYVNGIYFIRLANKEVMKVVKN